MVCVELFLISNGRRDDGSFNVQTTMVSRGVNVL